MRILPREEKFFVLFTRQVEIISQAAGLLLEGVNTGGPRMAAVAKEILDLEHQGDEVIHDIFTRLNQTFITPLDPEDIHSLSSKLDDVLDGIEDSAHRIVAYRLDATPPAVVKLCGIVARCCNALQQAVGHLEHDHKAMNTSVIEINRLENEADNVVRTAVADLFENEKDAIQLIKLKEVYEILESTTDFCEDVADVLQNVIVKNS